MGLSFSAMVGGAATQITKERDEDRRTKADMAKAAAIAKITMDNQMRVELFRDGVARRREAETLKNDIARSKSQLAAARSNYTAGAPQQSVDTSGASGGSSMTVQGGGASNGYVPSYNEFDYDASEKRAVLQFTDSRGVVDASKVAKFIDGEKATHQSTYNSKAKRGSTMNTLWKMGMSEKDMPAYIDKDGNIKREAMDWKAGYTIAIEEQGLKYAQENYKGNINLFRERADSSGRIVGVSAEAGSGKYRFKVTTEGTAAAKSTMQALWGGRNEQGTVVFDGQAKNSGIPAVADSMSKFATAVAGSTREQGDAGRIATQLASSLQGFSAFAQANTITKESIFETDPTTGAELGFTQRGKEVVDLFNKSIDMISNEDTAVAYEGLLSSMKQLLPQSVHSRITDISDTKLLDRVTALNSAGRPIGQYMSRKTLLRLDRIIQTRKGQQSGLSPRGVKTTPVIDVPETTEEDEAVLPPSPVKEDFTEKYKPSEVGSKIMEGVSNFMRSLGSKTFPKDITPDEELRSILPKTTAEEREEASQKISGMSSAELVKTLEENTLSPEEDLKATTAYVLALNEIVESKGRA